VEVLARADSGGVLGGCDGLTRLQRKAEKHAGTGTVSDRMQLEKNVIRSEGIGRSSFPSQKESWEGHNRYGKITVQCGWKGELRNTT
jgi:hypothetical protein